jgi:phosphoglucosamine mutase
VLKFGTDGLRGVANVELTPEVAMALGRVAARSIGGDRWAVGRDTRRSGPMLEAAFSAGLVAEGADVVSLGVAPTPEVAWWAAAKGIPAAVISASHNRFADNGIKLFAAGGLKLSDEVERSLEDELARSLDGPKLAAGDVQNDGADKVGQIRQIDARSGYGASVVHSIKGRSLGTLRLVVDCAHGAASAVAPGVLQDLGADVEVVNASPDGENINLDCGSTHPAGLQKLVVSARADAGIAFDGDADRVLLVDSSGRLIDGDQIIAVLARDLAGRHQLTHNTVVVTVMTNLGFRLGMVDAGIEVVETPVGDRYVLAALEGGGFALGGEQSGHVIFRQLATTGDGLLTAVSVLDVMARSGRPLGELADAAMTRLPQVLRNVRVAKRDPAIVDRVSEDIASVEKELGERGRVLVRPSGTEPLIRVMVEAPSEAAAAAAAERLVDAVASVSHVGVRPEA